MQPRDGYVNRVRTPFIHSLALVGMRNIRDYKAKLRDDADTLGSPSPASPPSSGGSNNLSMYRRGCSVQKLTHPVDSLHIHVTLNRPADRFHGRLDRPRHEGSPRTD